jgi:hypothetical protein
VAKGQAAKDALPPGSVSRAEGLEAWKRIEAVPSSPRSVSHPSRSQRPLNPSNRRVRTRMHGGVGGGGREADPYPDRRMQFLNEGGIPSAPYFGALIAATTDLVEFPDVRIQPHALAGPPECDLLLASRAG